MDIPKPIYVILCLIIPLGWGVLTDFIFSRLGLLKEIKDENRGDRS
ncbi:hypothetical protein J7M22_06090 [Candidatus Poribacteria bacterium]|nr:hypothetical protein [Candidatus Poribacteria bacterium]